MSIFSTLKVEKVVKPPHMPVAKNSFKLVEIKLLLSLKASTIPIAKLPIIFIIKVENGNPFVLNTLLNKYLHIAPIAPPKPTNKKLLIIFLI